MNHSVLTYENDVSNLDIYIREELDEYEHIQELSINGNCLVCIEGVVALCNLRSLQLSGNALCDISAISSLQCLQSIDVSDNAIIDVSSLSALTRLRSIRLARNQIECIPDLSACLSLQILDLSANIISCITRVSSRLPSSMSLLSLAHNALESIQVLSYLAGLDKLNHLLLHCNPFELQATLHRINYREFTVFILPCLHKLNNCVVTSNERVSAQRLFCDSFGVLSESMLKLLNDGRENELMKYLRVNTPLTIVNNTISIDDKLFDTNLDDCASSKFTSIGINNDQNSNNNSNNNNNNENNDNNKRSNSDEINNNNKNNKSSNNDNNHDDSSNNNKNNSNNNIVIET